MPQMMPLWWTFMIIMTITMLLFIIIFMYFLYLPKFMSTSNYRQPLYSHWTWLW